MGLTLNSSQKQKELCAKIHVCFKVSCFSFPLRTGIREFSGLIAANAACYMCPCVCTSQSAVFNHHSGPKRLSIIPFKENRRWRTLEWFHLPEKRNPPRVRPGLFSHLHNNTTTTTTTTRGCNCLDSLWSFASPPCVGLQTIPKCIVLNENESLPALCACVCACVRAGACTVLRVLCHQGGLLQLTLTCAVNRSALRRRRLFFSLVNGPYRQHLMKINDQL